MRWGTEMGISEKFLERCRIFHNKEDRHIEFPKAHSKDRVEGVSHILEKWNSRVWKRVEREKAVDQVEKAIKDVEIFLNEFSGETIEDIDLERNSEAIKKVFEKFEEKDSIKITGASKALHLLNQDLFVMWDMEIRENYHKRLHSKIDSLSPLSHRDKDYRDCYYAFHKDCKEFAKKLKEERTLESILEDHFTDLKPSTKKLYDKFDYRETIPKMIDEYNYVTFTLQEADLRSPWEV